MSLSPIELQVLSRIIYSEDENELEILMAFDSSYFDAYKEEIEFIHYHKDKYNKVPDYETFRFRYPDVYLIENVKEPITYLKREIEQNKSRIMLVEMFNKMPELSFESPMNAWAYIRKKCDIVEEFGDKDCLDLVKDAKARSEYVLASGKKPRIPTGFPEIDKAIQGGLNTEEELAIILARTNVGKSWVCVKIMESAQRNGFSVLYYSPEMRGAYIGTRFDTWRGNFKNTNLNVGDYSKEYLDYIEELEKEETSAVVIEDKDVEGGKVDYRVIERYVKKYKIDLVIVDGISYMDDAQNAKLARDKLTNIAHDLINKISKVYKCPVVIAAQANRATNDEKDEKGVPFPTSYNIAGSDGLGTTATQVFALRQIFETHVLDIRVEKARYTERDGNVFSYAWDVNTGNVRYIPKDVENVERVISPITPPVNITEHTTETDMLQAQDTQLDLDDFNDVEF